VTGTDFECMVQFEHLFWLQILGDHSRFILDALSPRETVEIQKAERFIIIFDGLLDEARDGVQGTALSSLSGRVSTSMRSEDSWCDRPRASRRSGSATSST
jgi:hypothetical protein